MVDKNIHEDEILIDKSFKVIKQLGKGYTSEVVLAKYMKTGQEIAIKIYKAPNNDIKLMFKTFKHEVDVMKGLDNKYLLKILAANEKGTYITKNSCKEITYIGVELAEKAELFDFIADYGSGFSDSHCRKIFQEIMSGISALHSKGIAHRDLKTENIFLDKDYNVKVGDFGFAKFFDPSSDLSGKFTTRLGTTGYQCPELLTKSSYSGISNDIFACGVILFVLYFGHPPFKQALKTDQWYKNIYDDNFDKFWAPHLKHHGKNVDINLLKLIYGMLAYHKRFTLEEVINNEWYKGNTPSNKDFLEDMSDRFKKVNERREKDRLINLKSDSQVEGVIHYRGDEDDLQLLIDSIDKLQVENVTLTRNLPKFYLQYESNDVSGSLKTFLNFFIGEQGGDAELIGNEYSLRCKFDLNKLEESLIPKAEDDDENEDSIVHFIVNAYIDEDSQKTILEFATDETTNYIELKSVFNYVQEKILG